MGMKKKKTKNFEQLKQKLEPEDKKNNEPQMDTTDTSVTKKKFKEFKPVYSRVSVDPSRKYQTPESRESWGPNVKGKKFRKEKGKKKRCPNAGVRIDGAVNSVRLDA